MFPILFSCKSDDGKSNGLNRIKTESHLIDSETAIDTISFFDFFENYIFDKKLQKVNNTIFFSSKDFITYLNHDTLSVFEEKINSNKQDLIVLDFKKNKNSIYKFEKIDNKWSFLGSNTILVNTLSENNFVDFLIKFSKDSIYQKKHILFPLENYSLDDDYQTTSQKIEKEEWNHFNLVEEIESLLFLANIDSNNVFRNIYYRGIDNGILVKLTFKRVNNEWFLVKTEDYST